MYIGDIGILQKRVKCKNAGSTKIRFKFFERCLQRDRVSERERAHAAISFEAHTLPRAMMARVGQPASLKNKKTQTRQDQKHNNEEHCNTSEPLNDL